MTPMRVVVLHSDVAPDAPVEDLDTLETSQAVAETLRDLGHEAMLAPFVAARLADVVRGADLVFNMVESVWEQDWLAAIAPQMLDRIGLRYTGSGAAQLALASDKLLSKRLFARAALPTAGWSEAPDWCGIDETHRYIVKAVSEDASIGLDDASVVRGRDAVIARAADCAARLGGRWFAEEFIDGREYNVAMVERDGVLDVLPIPEMCFENWPADKPRIVGYRAKWDMDSAESDGTPRLFGLEDSEPALAAELKRLALDAARLFDMRGYARVDFRVDRQGRPVLLEINPNPSIDPVAGFMAAAARAGMTYRDLIAAIVDAALRR